MAENVQTGGLMSFRDSNERKELNDEKKKEIREAYAIAEERRRKRRKEKAILWVIIGIIIVLILGFLIFKSL